VTIATRADAAAAEKVGAVRILPLNTDLNYGPVTLLCRKASRDDDMSLTRFREETMKAVKLARASRASPPKCKQI
jgi:hypothetical protein